jgi:hypothetical protein
VLTLSEILLGAHDAYAVAERLGRDQRVTEE